MNGDGYSDVIFGARYYSSPSTLKRGAASVYYGNSGDNRTVNARQRSYSNGAPVARLGSSGYKDGFRLAATGTTTFGRGRLKLQWGVKPFDVAFDGSGLRESREWYDTGTDGVEIKELVFGLDADTLYRWRFRLLYDPSSCPYLPHSRWFHFPLGGAAEADLRTGKADSDGDGLLDAIELTNCTDAFDAAPSRRLFHFQPPALPWKRQRSGSYPPCLGLVAVDFICTPLRCGRCSIAERRPLCRCPLLSAPIEQVVFVPVPESRMVQNGFLRPTCCRADFRALPGGAPAAL